MNRYGADRVPFMFIVDFEMKNPEIHKLNAIPQGIRFLTPLLSNYNPRQIYIKPVLIKKFPVPFELYLKAFENVMYNIQFGNSYLLNLTFPTHIEVDLTLEEIFNVSVAKYKLIYNDIFVVFSPEIFIRINDGKIRSFPMKGTIDSSVKDAERVILNDIKEEAEHNTIIDLIRNDLSKVADNVQVEKYRYIDRIKSAENELLQVSSEISGVLEDDYEHRLGEIIVGLLPAGSVTGAPKKETVNIIRESENSERGYYSGIFGVYDGKSLDSAVMIRYIEKESDKLYFRSGGGITYLSDPEKEYFELLSKVYVPVG